MEQVYLHIKNKVGHDCAKLICKPAFEYNNELYKCEADNVILATLEAGDFRNYCRILKDNLCQLACKDTKYLCLQESYMRNVMNIIKKKQIEKFLMKYTKNKNETLQYFTVIHAKIRESVKIISLLEIREIVQKMSFRDSYNYKIKSIFELYEDIIYVQNFCRLLLTDNNFAKFYNIQMMD